MPRLMLSALLMSFFDELVDLSSYPLCHSNLSDAVAAPVANMTQRNGLSRAALFRKMVNIAQRGGKVVVWTSQSDFTLHFSSIVAGIQIGRLQTGNLLDKDWPKMTELVEKSKCLLIHVVFRSPAPLKPLITSIRELQSQSNPPGFLFIDLCVVTDRLSNQGQTILFSGINIADTLKSHKKNGVVQMYFYY